MLAKISIVVAIISAIIHKRGIYLWLSIAAGLVIVIFGYLSSYIVARPAIEAFKQAVRDMEEQGATTEEIEAFMDRDEDHSELNKEKGPTWILIIITIASIGAFVLLGIGIVNG